MTNADCPVDRRIVLSNERDMVLSRYPGIIAASLFSLLILSFANQSAAQSLFQDAWVRPAQVGLPAYPNSGVQLQNIQTFDPYGAPSLPPPLGAPAYPAPSGNYVPPPINPPNYGGNYVPPPYSNSQPSAGAWPFQNTFNLNGGGLYGGFQAAILEPRFGNFTISNSNDFSQAVTLRTAPDHGFSFSPRIIAGFEGREGLGFRVRWWHFGDEQSGFGRIDLSGPDEVFDPATVSTEIKADAIDMELTQDGRFHNWEFLVSGGVRYAQLDSITVATWNNGAERFFRAETDFDGVGPSLSFSARRSMRQWEGVTFLVNSRFSFLFGDVQVEHLANLDGTVVRPDISVLDVDDVMPVWDLQIGAQWTRRMQSGATFYVGAFFEAELWDWIGPGLISSDMGFWGPTLAIGISQ